MSQYPNPAPHPLASLSGSRPTTASSSLLPTSRILHQTPATTHSPESLVSPHATGSGEGGAPIGGRVTSGSKRARGQTAGGGASDDEDAEGKKKRNRQALSCGECKRRKIKCDRKIPCIACIKRNSPQLCSWEDAKIEPEPQVFALNTDLRRLASRLSQVEAFLQTLPPELRAGAPQPDTLVGGGVRYYGGCSGVDVEGEGEEGRSKVEGASDTEEAAVNLEATAFGGRAYGTANFRPVDSLPFYDTKAPKTPRTYRSELTRELTSIIAPAINVEAGISCSVQLGLDFGIPVEEVEAARRAAVAKVLAVLPNKESSLYLVGKYFEDFDWIHHTIYKKSFDAEMERYWEMMEAGRGADVDPLWLALYSMVLALSIDGLSSMPGPGLNLRGSSPDETPGSQALKWFAAAQRFLVLGDWLGAPQARSIMTVILLGQYIQISSFGGQANRFLSWLASAIRIAQLMGLHQLGDDPRSMPPEDPCWPPGANSVKREGALRIFGVLLFMDWLAATTRFPSYMLHPSQFNTPPLSNLNDSDLSATDWRSSPLPRNIVTDASFEFCKFTIAFESRKVFDKLVTESATFSYATVLELDRGYRHVLDQVPDIWKTEHSSQEAKSPRLRWKRHVVQESIHSRIVRLHRPFLTRGYNANSRYRYSTEQCVASAKIVIATHHNILDVTNNVWFLYNHALGAAIVLFCDLFHAIDNDFPEVVIENKKETLVTAFEIFGRHNQISSPVLRAVVQQGSRILGGLFMAEEKRRVTRAARTLVGSEGTQAGNIESFAQVLQRISNSIDIKSHAPVSYPNSMGPHVFAHANQADTSSPLEALNYGYDDTPMPQVGDAVNFDHLNSMFFQDLGVAPAAQPGFNLWSQTTPSSNGATGLTPPDEFAFLGTGVDWQNLGVGQPPLDANALAATALLGQMGFSY